MKIGFSKPKNHPFPILSWLIRWIEKTEFSHTYIEFELLDNDFIYEARGKSVHIISKKEFLKNNEKIQEFKLNISNIKRCIILSYMHNNCGAPYGLLQLFGIGIIKIFQIFNKEIQNPFSDKKETQVCVEAVANVLRDVLNWNELNDTDSLGLKKFYKIVKKNYNSKYM